ncbi:hypothetical protein, partial [Klebsiella pneumoniae]
TTYYLDRGKPKDAGQMCRVFLANKAQVLDIPAFTVTPANTILVNRNGIFVTIKRWQDLTSDYMQVIIARSVRHV